MSSSTNDNNISKIKHSARIMQLFSSASDYDQCRVSVDYCEIPLISSGIWKIETTFITITTFWFEFDNIEWLNHMSNIKITTDNEIIFNLAGHDVKNFWPELLNTKIWYIPCSPQRDFQKIEIEYTMLESNNQAINQSDKSMMPKVLCATNIIESVDNYSDFDQDDSFGWSFEVSKFLILENQYGTLKLPNKTYEILITFYDDFEHNAIIMSDMTDNFSQKGNTIKFDYSYFIDNKINNYPPLLYPWNCYYKNDISFHNINKIQKYKLFVDAPARIVVWYVDKIKGSRANKFGTKSIEIKNYSHELIEHKMIECFENSYEYIFIEPNHSTNNNYSFSFPSSNTNRKKDSSCTSVGTWCVSAAWIVFNINHELSYVLQKIPYHQILQKYSLLIGGQPYIDCHGLELSMFGHAKMIEAFPSDDITKTNIALRVPIVPIFPCKTLYHIWQINCIIDKYNEELGKYIIKDFYPLVICEIIVQYADLNSVSCPLIQQPKLCLRKHNCPLDMTFDNYQILTPLIRPIILSSHSFGLLHSNYPKREKLEKQTIIRLDYDSNYEFAFIFRDIDTKKFISKFNQPFESISVVMKYNDAHYLLKTLCMDNKERISFHLDIDTTIQDNNLPIWRIIFQPAPSFDTMFDASLQLYSHDKYTRSVIATCKEYVKIYADNDAEIHIMWKNDAVPNIEIIMAKCCQKRIKFSSGMCGIDY